MPPLRLNASMGRSLLRRGDNQWPDTSLHQSPPELLEKTLGRAVNLRARTIGQQDKQSFVPVVIPFALNPRGRGRESFPPTRFNRGKHASRKRLPTPSAKFP